MEEVVLNGRTVDLRKALPLVIRDWKALELQGLTPAKLRDPTFSDIAAIAFYVLHKADPTVTQDEIDSLPFPGPAMQAVFQALNISVSQGIDAPFSMPSTPSAGPTAGARAT